MKTLKITMSVLEEPWVSPKPTALTTFQATRNMLNYLYIVKNS
jgi:hypothetical protein